MKVFDQSLPFYKGNLHAHTTRSDGKLTPEECIQRFKDHGYDFLAITDHRKPFGGYQDHQILVVPAAEYDVNYLSGGPERCFHITGVGLTHDFDQTLMTPQQIVDAIKKQGAFCTLCHPIWSMNTLQDLMTLDGYDAIEIFNTVSEVYSGRGYSGQYIDLLASRGIYKLITAVDDCHFYAGDAFKGRIMVQAEDRTWDSIHKALMEKRFYATTGPSIYQIERDGDHVAVDLSPVDHVRFMTNSLYDHERLAYAPEGGTITHAEYTMKGCDRFVRIEGWDKNGGICWSNLLVR